MPGLVEAEESPFKTIQIKELHPTFAAEVFGVDFEDVSEEQFSEIMAAMTKYGVCVFRNTGLTDAAHVSFSRRFGELDTVHRYMPPGRRPRYGFYELFDAGNVSTEPTGSLNHNADNGEDDNTAPSEPQPIDPSSLRAHTNRGNGHFHADSSFNPRRASFSLLRAAQLPPKGTCADTLFADSRTAAEELGEDILDFLAGSDTHGEAGNEDTNGAEYGNARGLIGVHCIAHSRKLGSPEYFADLDPTLSPMARHRILQRHESSGRLNLYVGAHVHHIEEEGREGESADSGDGEETEKGKEISDSWSLVQKLNAHVSQDKYVVSVPWNDPGDLVIWDNRAVLHRVGEGSFEGKFIRDLRRTTVHDDSPTAWGLNLVGTAFPSSLTGPNGDSR